MTIFDRIRTKAQQALTGIGNFIDRDKGMSGVQLVPGGFQGGVQRVKQAVQTNPDQFNLYKQMGQGNIKSGFKPLDFVGQGVGKAIDVGATFAKQAGQGLARDVAGLGQAYLNTEAKKYGQKPLFQEESKVSELFPGNKYAQGGANLLFGKDETIRTPQGTGEYLKRDYNIPMPVGLAIGAIAPASNFIPGGGAAAKTGGKQLLKEGVEQGGKQLLKEGLEQGGKTIVKEVVEAGGKEAIEQSGKSLFKEGVEQNIKNVIKEAPETLEAILKNGGEVVDELTPVLAKGKQAVAKAPETLEAVLKSGNQAGKQLIEEAAQQSPKVAADVAEATKRLNPLTRFEDTFRRWVNTKEGYTNWRAGDIKRNPVLTAFDNEGLDAIKALQSGKDGERFAPIKQFTDELFEMERKAGLITPESYRKNYLPQMWENTPEEVQQVFAKTVGAQPGFSKQRLFKDYTEGIEAGLTPRFTKMSDLLEARFKTAQKALADREFIDTLVDSGNAVPLDKAPKGWVSVAEITKDNKPLAVPPQLAKMMGNYTMEGSKLLEKTAQFVAETKQTLLSAGIPKTGWNFHTGVNIPARAAAVRNNPFGAVVDSVVWNTRPSTAEKYITETVPKEITDGLLKQGLTIARSTSGGDYGFKPSQGEGVIKGARNMFDKLFSEAAFDKVLPAHKLKVGWEAYGRAIKQGMSEDEAFRVGAETANTVFGGINTAEMARNKDFQNIARTFLLAPDWLESNIKIAGKTGKSLLTPAGWKDKTLAPYRQFARNATFMYSSMAMMNKALSGHWPWENGAGQEFNLATGTYDERGRERMIPIFGTAFDFARIPYTIVSGLAQNKPEAVTNILKNRLSPPVSAATAVLTNSDYRGQEITSPDKTPLENILGLGRQAATAFGIPSQATNTVKFLSGDSTPEEFAASLVEAPIRYRGGANTEKKLQEAESLKSAGLTNKQINEELTYKPEKKGLFGGLFGGGESEVAPPPTGKMGKKEKEAYKKTINSALDSGAIPDTEALSYGLFDKKSASSTSIEERTKVYQALNKVMGDEYYTDEQKAAIVKASGATPENAEYYTLASKDQDVRLQELLPKFDNMDDKQVTDFLMMGRRAVGGKQLVSNGMVDYLYENGYIDKNSQKAIKSLKYDEIKDKFYFTKSFGGGSGSGGGGSKKKTMSYKEARSLFNVEIPKFSELKSVENLLAQYQSSASQKGDSNERLLEDILYKAPTKKQKNQNLWF